MKTRNKLIGILASVFLACCCAIGITQIKARDVKTTMAETTGPSITIESKNLSYSDSIYILYAVSNEGFDREQSEIQMLFWNEQQDEYIFGTQDYVASNEGDKTVNGKDCLIFYSDGIAAKEMTDDIYACACATVDGVVYYSDVVEYSVEKYVAEMREKGVSAELETLFDAMLDYGAAAQAVLEDNTTNSVAATSVEEASSAETGTSIAIESNNVSYADSLYILYAVSNEGFDREQNEIQMLFWNEPQTEYVLGSESYSATNRGSKTIKDKDCLIFYSDGIAAKEMTDDVYARACATVDGVVYYSETVKFSVLEYVYQMREKGGLSDKMETLFTAMLNYGAAAQVVLDYNTDRPANATYYKVSAENGALTDGTAMGRFLANETVTLRADAAPGEGYVFLGWYEGDTLVSNAAEYTFTVDKAVTYTAKWTDSAAYTVNYYLQNVEDDNYTLQETAELTGKIGSTATAEVKEYEHFTYDESASADTISGAIAEDGSLVLSVYYTRDTYKIKTSVLSDETTDTKGTVTGSGTYKYGKEVTLTATTVNEAYTFAGWYDGDTLVSEEAEYTFTVEKAMTYTARWFGADVKYTVYYLAPSLDESENVKLATEVSYLPSGMPTPNPEIREFEHFTYNEEEGIWKAHARIRSTGTTNSRVYYLRNEYTVTAATDNEKFGTVTGGGTYKYETQITLTAMPNAGYTFAGWYDGDTLVSNAAEFTFTVDKNVTYTAKWGASYTVKYYVQNLEDDNYTLHETVELKGLIGSTAIAEVKEYEHFTYDESASADTISGAIAEDGSLVLDVYYTRNTYTVAAAVDNELSCTLTGGGSYKYGAEVTLTATMNKWYIFIGWYDGDTLVSEEAEYTFTVEKDVTYMANTHTVYRVTTYLQNLEDDNYTHTHEMFYGTAGTVATAVIKEYDHFTYYEGYSKNAISGTIAADYSLRLKVYYLRNKYTVTTASNNEKAGTVTAGGEYKYETQLTLTATTNAGYTFNGWYDGKTLVSEAAEYTFTVDKNITYTAVWSVNTDTKYTVNYYWKEDGATGYTLRETVQLQGETDTTVTAEIKTYEGYTYNKSASTIRGVISGDGSLVLKVYYVYNATQTATLEFEEIEGGNAYKVTGIGTYDSGTLEVPSTYNEKLVTTIGAEAFYNVRGIGKLILPDSVTTIEDYAFASCLDLTEVTMGDGVTSIGKYAFAYCNQMDTITFSTALQTIDENAFYGCLRIKSITLPNTLTRIEKEAFKDCKKVQTITFGTGLAYIGESAFYRCEALKSLTIPNGAPTVIEKRAFMNCSSILKITLGNAVKTIGEEAFSVDDVGSGLKLRELVIGDSVTSIGAYAFKGSRKLVKVTLGSSVSSIGSYAFQNCFVLYEVYNKSSSLSLASSHSSYIAYYAQYVYNYKWYTTYKTRISQDEDGFYYYTYGGDKVLLGVVLDTTTDIVIPDDVTEVSTYACYNETYITGVTVGSNSSCTTIGEKAFGNCYNIRKLNLIGSSLTTLAEQAFYNNTHLTQITIGDSVTTIGGKAFIGCSVLKSVTIGKGVTTVGEDAFKNCGNLTNIYIKDLAAWCNISGVSYLMSYGSTSKNLYLNDELVTNLVIPSGVTSISAYAFAYCSNIASVTIPSTVTSIGDKAFYKCARLVEVINKSALAVEKGVNSNGYVGYYALSVSNGDSSYVSKLSYNDGYIVYTDGANKILVGYPGVKTDLVLPKDITEIYQYAFYDSGLLTNVYITDMAAWCKISGLKYLMQEGSSTKNLYLNDELVTNLVIPDTVTSISNYAFYNCDSLTSVTIGKGVKSIGNQAFAACGSLTSVTIPGSVTSIGKNAFYNCSNLTSITFKDTSWYITTSVNGWNDKKGGTETDVSNPSTNATYFKSEYAKYYWYAKDHSYEATVTAPTCTENGYTTYTCSDCGYTYTDDEVAATGHSYKGVVTAPTCTENGYTTYTCSDCGDTYTADEVAATGHNYVDGTCSNCGAVNHVHEYTVVVTAPTCTENGYTTHTCSCGDTYTTDEVAATGHNYVATVTPPTCMEDGYTTHTCDKCGDTYTEAGEAARGEHIYEDDFVCDCGEINGALGYFNPEWLK